MIGDTGYLGKQAVVVVAARFGTTWPWYPE
jgi:hypothetical protein